MGAVLQHRARRDGIWDEHEAIAAAIRDGDVERAGALSERHAAAARTALVASLEASLHEARTRAA